MKRAAARRDAAEQAANGLSPEEAFILIQAEEAANRTKAEEAKELAKSKAEKALTKPAEGAESGKIEEPSTEAAEAKDSETAIEKVDEVSDELCPDKDYNPREDSTTSQSFKSPPKWKRPPPFDYINLTWRDMPSP